MVRQENHRLQQETQGDAKAVTEIIRKARLIQSRKTGKRWADHGPNQVSQKKMWTSKEQLFGRHVRISVSNEQRQSFQGSDTIQALNGTIGSISEKTETKYSCFRWWIWGGYRQNLTEDACIKSIGKTWNQASQTSQNRFQKQREPYILEWRWPIWMWRDVLWDESDPILPYTYGLGGQNDYSISAK